MARTTYRFDDPGVRLVQDGDTLVVYHPLRAYPLRFPNATAETVGDSITLETMTAQEAAERWAQGERFRSMAVATGDCDTKMGLKSLRLETEDGVE